MAHAKLGWGQPPSERYATLAAKFRPIFAKIAEGAVERETTRGLPYAAIQSLKESGFTAIRVPLRDGGAGASLGDFYALLVELSEADSNVTQALLSHFGFAENVICRPDSPERALWSNRLLQGEIAGNAWTEIGTAAQGAFSTTVSQEGERHYLTGQKFYTTGSLFADWIDVGASCAEGEVSVLVNRAAAGVEVLDDWNGFGQIGTASGTTIFTKVEVEASHILPADGLFKYAPAFYQVIHLASLAGIGRAITRDVAGLVAARKRSYSNAAAPGPAQDPQVLQVIGRIRGAAYAASAIVAQVARALDVAHLQRDQGKEGTVLSAVEQAELEASQALPVVSGLILEASTLLFDAAGASATLKPLALDRHWRNARTLSCHNPRIYKDRIVGDFAVNSTPPLEQWRIGVPG